MSNAAGKNRKKVHALGALVPVCLSEALARQGFAGSEVITRWEAIAGKELAPYSEPIRLQWPPKGHSPDPLANRQPAILHVRVEGAFALEFQIQAAVIIERINSYLGWQCVHQIRLKQGPVQKQIPVDKPKAVILDEQTEQRIADGVASIENEALRKALHNLGRSVAAKASTRT